MKWYDIRDRIIPYGMTFNITFGGRGIGKTYSTLKYLAEEKIKFIYLRNQQNEIDISCTDECNPFKAVNDDIGSSYYFEKISKDMCGIYDSDGLITGYAIALNTFAKLRGVDFSDIDFIFFEEFNTSLRINKKQGELLFNLYETVNRNRELKGKPPVIVLMVGNAVTIANPVMDSFGLIQDAEMMISTGKEVVVYEDRGILLEITHATAKEIMESKSKTALYKAIVGSDYYKHSIDNQFIYDSFYNVGKRNLNEYRPICVINDISIMIHKFENHFYCTKVMSGKFKIKYDKNTTSKFLKEYGLTLRVAYADKNIFFDSYETKSHLLDILNI